MLNTKTIAGIVQEFLYGKHLGSDLLDLISIEYFDNNPEQGVVLRVPEDISEDYYDIFEDLLEHIENLHVDNMVLGVDNGLSPYDIAIYIQ